MFIYVLLLLFQNILFRCRILGWQRFSSFSFSTLNMLFYWLLNSTIWWEVNGHFNNYFQLYIVPFFSVFKIFPSSFFFQFGYDVLWHVFVYLFYLGYTELLECINLSSTKFGKKICHYFLSKFFCPLSLSYTCGSPIMHVLDL